MEISINTLEDLEQEAAHFIGELAPASAGATLVTLSGELGAGKTAFTKAAARALGVEESVTSPTFVLEKIYLLPPHAPWKRLVHIDAYRLKGGEELALLGFDEIMHDPGSIVMLEWPEMVADTLPRPAAALRFETRSDGARVITSA